VTKPRSQRHAGFAFEQHHRKVLMLIAFHVAREEPYCLAGTSFQVERHAPRGHEKPWNSDSCCC
jgi:hypothetical protein